MKVFHDFVLKNISWVKIGGTTPEYVEAENLDEFIEIVKKVLLKRNDLEVLGWGANTLISDKGITSTVLKLKTNYVEVLENFKPTDVVPSRSSELMRHSTDVSMAAKKTKHAITFDDILYEDSCEENVYVKVSSSVSLPFLINWSISRGITGLQMFSGIPGTVGGSVFNNIHGGPKLMSDFIYSVEVMDESGNIIHLKHNELYFDYNESYFKANKQIILTVIYQLKSGDKNRAQLAAVSWAKRKANQPKNSLGSVFYNLTDDEKKIVEKEVGFQIHGTGYLIDHVLKLGGYRVGDIMIPIEENKNIFVNLGNGKAEDYLKVMKKVYNETFERFGIRLKTEVYLKGFDREEIQEFI